MQVYVNNKAVEVEEGVNLSALLKTMKLDPSTLVAEVNREIVAKEGFDSRMLGADDRIELVRIIGGG